MHVPFMGEAAGMKQMLVWSLYPCLLILSPSFFSRGFPLTEGRGTEKGLVLLSDLSVSPPRPLPPQQRHYILPLLLVLLATVPRQQSHGNRAPRQQRAVCLPNGAAIGRTGAQALHPEQTETSPTETELSSQQTAGTVQENQGGFCKNGE